MRGEQVRDAGDVALPADEARQRRPEVRRRTGPGVVLTHDDACSWCQLQRRVLTEDRRLQPAQLRARIQAELVGEHPPGVAEGTQRVRLTARAVQGQHQLAPQALAERCGPNRPVEVGDQVGVATHRQQGVETVFAGGRPQFLQAARGRHHRRHITELHERITTPQSERLVEAANRGAGSTRAECRPPVLDQPFESNRIDILRHDRQRIPGRPRDDHVCSHRATELEDGDLQRISRLLRRPVTPQIVDQTLGRHDGPGPEREQREQRALAAARHPDRPPVVAANLQGAEKAHLHEQNLIRLQGTGKRESSEPTAGSSTMAT